MESLSLHMCENVELILIHLTKDGLEVLVIVELL